MNPIQIAVAVTQWHEKRRLVEDCRRSIAKLEEASADHSAAAAKAEADAVAHLDGVPQHLVVVGNDVFAVTSSGIALIEATVTRAVEMDVRPSSVAPQAAEADPPVRMLEPPGDPSEAPADSRRHEPRPRQSRESPLREAVRVRGTVVRPYR